MPDDTDFLAAYPKQRPPLPRRIAEIYETHYRKNREGETTASSMAQKMEAWMHRQVAGDLAGRQRVSTLELGAGTLNQLAYEPQAEPYDIVEPFGALFEKNSLLSRVRTVYADLSQVPDTLRYDRITSVATLEHICDLPAVVAKSACLLGEGASFRAAIPSEGTFLWTLGWKLTTGLEFRLRHGLDYGDLMRHEHVNTAREIKQVLDHFFIDVASRHFGPSASVSLYQYHECRAPRLERCTAYLASIR